PFPRVLGAEAQPAGTSAAPGPRRRRRAGGDRGGLASGKPEAEAVSPPGDDFDARSTYDAASRDYEDASRDFWQYISLRTVERLGLAAGERVLDVPLCRGSAALAPAER